MINVGFIGCGAMGRDHVRRITDKCGNAQVVGVYDTVLGNAKQAIEDNRLDATIYDSVDALIDDRTSTPSSSPAATTCISTRCCTLSRSASRRSPKSR